MEKSGSDGEKLSRRGFACRLAGVAAGGGLASLASAVQRPVDGAVVVDLGRAEFAPLKQVGGAVKVAVAGADYPVIVTRIDEERFAAFSSECTHWSCEVDLPDEKGIVRCPCHTSRFDIRGKLIDGQAQEDLHRVDVVFQTNTAVEGRSWGQIKKENGQ